MIKKERLDGVMGGRKGFTLIEILIVVAIIAILASVVLIGLGPTQQAGRDARRLSDLQQIQNGLELYFNKCGYYPGTSVASPCGAFAAASTYGGAGAGAVQAILKGAGIGVNTTPNDPTAGATYKYATTPGGTSYVLQATLENKSNSVFNTYTAPDTTTYTLGETVACGTIPNYCVTL